MYADAASSVWINNNFCEEFGVKVGVHQHSFLSTLLFVIVMEALSQDCRCGCSLELLYPDNLVIIDGSLDGLLNQVIVWKESFDAKGLQGNMSKTKIVVSNLLAERLVDPSKYPWSVLCVRRVRAATPYFVTTVKLNPSLLFKHKRVSKTWSQL